MLEVLAICWILVVAGLILLGNEAHRSQDEEDKDGY